MIGAILSGLWPYLAGAFVMFLGAFGLYRKGRSDVIAKRELEAARTTIKQEVKGREAVLDEQRAVEGSGNRDIVDRLRRRDGDWRGM